MKYAFEFGMKIENCYNCPCLCEVKTEKRINYACGLIDDYVSSDDITLFKDVRCPLREIK